jgi:hypothetical protein
MGLVDEINSDIARLEQIQFTLGKPLEKLVNRVSLRSEETPEKNMNIPEKSLSNSKKKSRQSHLSNRMKKKAAVVVAAAVLAVSAIKQRPSQPTNKIKKNTRAKPSL